VTFVLKKKGKSLLAHNNTTNSELDDNFSKLYPSRLVKHN